MSPNGGISGYAVARKTLIDGCRALEVFPRNSFVLVGAHAVYLRAPESIPSIAPFTLDGDLAANPVYIGRPRDIRDRLEAAGFSMRGRTPGLYQITGAPADHSPMTLSSVDEAVSVDSIVVEVAGIVALLVSKGWKIGERFAEGSQAFQEVGKDIVDVYRLLRASKSEDLQATLVGLSNDQKLSTVARYGASQLHKLCQPQGPGIQLLQTIVGPNDEGRLIVESLGALVEEFYELVNESFKPAQ
jgi:hypothetical protein